MIQKWLNNNKENFQEMVQNELKKIGQFFVRFWFKNYTKKSVYLVWKKYIIFLFLIVDNHKNMHNLERLEKLITCASIQQIIYIFEHILAVFVVA